MTCPNCGHTKSIAKNARTIRDYKRRTRHCLNCGHAWTTHEIRVEAATMKELHPHRADAFRTGQYLHTVFDGDNEQLEALLEGWDAA